VRRRLAIALMLCCLPAAGCGGSGGRSVHAGPVPPRGNAAAGKRTFEDAGCSGCHALAAAGANGSFGPNLDHSNVTYRQAFEQVSGGGGGMPAFGDRLTRREIANVAEFVVSERSG
jgi:mono/diheme cytochrome c family protein